MKTKTRLPKVVLFDLVLAAVILFIIMQNNPLAAVSAANITTNIIYCTIDGTTLQLDLYYPQSSNAALPLIMYVHGGGWSTGDKLAPEPWDLTPILSAGFIYASVNYRLAPTYQFPAMIIDVKCALRFLKANAATYRIDPNRIGLLGVSAGAQLVSLMGVTNKQIDQSRGWLQGQWSTQNDTVQAVADLCGPADLNAFTDQNSDAVTKIEAAFNVPSIPNQKLVPASPITYIQADAKSIPPFLIMQGDKDATVPATQAQEFSQKLTQAGVVNQLIMVSNAGHGFVPVPQGATISPTMEQLNQDLVAFFDKYVKNAH